MVEQQQQPDTAKEEDKRKRRRFRLPKLDLKWEWSASTGLKVAGGGLFGVLVVVAVWWVTQHQQTEVPNVVGLSRVVAENQLRDKGLSLRETHDEVSTQPPGTVVRTDPPAGMKLDRDSGVVLFLAAQAVAGPTPTTTPGVTVSVVTGGGPVVPTLPGHTGVVVPTTTTVNPTTTPAQTVAGGAQSTTRAQAQPIHVRNDLTLGRYNWVDLDSGAYSPANGGDVYFGEDANTQAFYLQPMAQVTMANVGSVTPDYSTCAAARTTANTIPLTQLPANSVVCVRTDEGRVSAVKINGTSDGPNGRDLHISYTTWEKP